MYRFDGPSYEDFTPLFRINNATEIETRMTFNTEGTILYVAVCNRHCIYQVPYDAATHTFGNPVLLSAHGMKVAISMVQVRLSV